MTNARAKLLKFCRSNHSSRRELAIYLLATFFVMVGCLHFIHPRPFVLIVPDYLPHPRLLVFISGSFEILAGSGLIAASTRRWAGICLILLLVAIFPANINMAIKAPNIGSVIDWLLWLRLPLQPALGYLIWRLAVAPKKRSDD